jgi:glucosamine-6-phosphate deaminase
MNISINKNAVELGIEASKFISGKLNEIIQRNGEARIAVSTGSSQFEMFQALVKEKIEWNKVEVFHLDEYIGLPLTHPASFRKYLYERFVNLVPVRKFHGVDVEGQIHDRIRELTSEIRRKPIDIGFIGIGVNGHIAFNDPPADFNTKESYIIVDLNDECKMQQVGEGWFKTIDDVPKRAVSMSVWQIMQCKTIVSVVPHKVKANAVYNTFAKEVSNLVPATKLKQHNDFHLYLDINSASRVITL